jgi:ATP-binding cassette subfamily B protein
LFLCVAAVATLVVPFAFKQLIDHGFTQGVKSQVGVDQYFIGLFGVSCILAAATALRFYMVSWLGERVVADIRLAVYERMLLQSPEFFETTRTGEVLSRLTVDTTLVQTVVGTSLSLGLRNFFLFTGGMLMLAVTSVKLFLITIGLLTLVILPIIVLGRRVRKLSRASQDRVADSSATASEILSAMPTVQAFNQEAAEAQRFGTTVENSFQTALRRTRTRAWLTVVVILLVFGAIVFVLWLGASAVIGGAMSTGALAAFVLYAGLVAGSIAALTETWGDILRAAGATERLTELLDARSFVTSPKEPRALASASKDGVVVRVEQVQFHYPSRPDHAALERRSPWSDLRALASRPCFSCSCASTTPRGGPSRSTESQPTNSTCMICAASSVSFRRIRSSSRTMLWRTSATAGQERRTPRSSPPRARRRPTNSSSSFQKGTAPSSGNAVCGFRGDSVSASPSRAPF